MLKKPLLLLLLLFLFIVSLAQRGSSEDEAASNATGNSYALVVGISSYPNINRLLYADDDAHAFADFLVNHGICEKNNVTKLIDSVATKANFYKELKKLMNKTVENDRVFIYFAGHGDVETDIESGFLLCYNSESSNYPATDAIDISMLERYVNAFVKKNSKVVLITDACRSGNLAGGLAGASSTISSITKGFQNVIKILSCQPNQLSEEKPYQGGGHGVFTYHLVDGLSGLADRDNDQFVTLRELDFYLDEVSRETNKNQIPKVDGDPQAQVVKYEAALKNLVLARKNNHSNTASVSSIKKRNVIDSAWMDNTYYTAFNHHIRKLEFTEPAKANAWTAIQDAIKTKQPVALVEDMKLELAAVLEDEAQKWINKYLRGEIDSRQSIILSELINCRNYMALIQVMIGKDDFRYQEIKAKEEFFNAYYFYKTNQRNQFATSIQRLDQANKSLGEQAWLLHVQALLYTELKQFHKSIEKDRMALKHAPLWRYAWNHLGTNYRGLKQYDKAIECYQASLKLDSLNGVTWNHLGATYDDLEERKKAMECFSRSIALDPYELYAYTNLGERFAELKNYDSADYYLKKFIILDSAFSYGWERLGDYYSNRNMDQQAEAAYFAATRTDSFNTDAWNNLGILYENRKDIKRSEKYYRNAIKADSFNVHAWTNLADIINDLGNSKEAAKMFEHALGLDSSEAQTWDKYGTFKMQLKEWDEAEKFLQKAIDLDHSYISAWINLADVYRQTRRYDIALSVVQKALGIDSLHADLYNMKGVISDDIGQYPEAEKSYLKAIKINPLLKEAYSNLGLLYTNQGEYTKAMQYLNQSLRIDSNYISALNNLGNIYEYQGHRKEAEAYYLKAYRLDTNHVSTIINLAINTAHLGNEKQAEKYYQSAVRIDPASKQVWSNFAALKKKQKNPAEAIQYYQKAIRIDSGYIYAWYNLGLTYQEQNQHEEAEKSFLKTIALEPQHAYAIHQLGHVYFDTRHFDKAATYYAKSVKLLYDQSHFWETLLMAVDSLKDYKDVFEWHSKNSVELTDNQTFRTQLGYKFLKQKDFTNAEIHFLKALEFNNKDPWTSYNLACLYSLWNRKERALKHFEDALTKGFDDFDHISKDTDMDPIRYEPLFKKLVEKFRK